MVETNYQIHQNDIDTTKDSLNPLKGCEPALNVNQLSMVKVENVELDPCMYEKIDDVSKSWRDNTTNGLYEMMLKSEADTVEEEEQQAIDWNIQRTQSTHHKRKTNRVKRTKPALSASELMEQYRIRETTRNADGFE